MFGKRKKSKDSRIMLFLAFKHFLQDLFQATMKDLSLANLLTFITGAVQVPPLGFPDSISVKYSISM